MSRSRYARPVYESKLDRLNEREIVDVWLSWARATYGADVAAYKLPRRYIVDYAIRVGRSIRVYAEIKRRSVPFDKVDAVEISDLKIRRLRDLIADGFGGLLIFRFGDGEIRQVDLATIPRPPVVWSGRTDRGDPEDLEPMAVIGRPYWRRVEPPKGGA